MLTRESSLTLPLVFDIAAFWGNSTLSIVGSWVGDRAQLTCRNDLELVPIVFNVADVPGVPVGV